MHRKLILVVVLSSLLSIYGQKDDDHDLSPAFLMGRSQNSQFDARYSRGKCPEKFYQLGEECLYFTTDGRIYSWQQAERICSRRVARMLDQPPSSNMIQPEMNPKPTVRQIILNTPAKTEIFRALQSEYKEENFAIRLPSDYDKLERCNDGQDDKWPRYCGLITNPNATCFDTTSNGQQDICLREVDCNQRYLRIACEFTLPGNEQIKESQFRQCPIASRRSRIPIWAWITIGVSSGIVLLIILAVIFGIIMKSRKNTPKKKRNIPEPRVESEKVIRIATTDKSTSEPLLKKITTNIDEDNGYLQPKSLPADSSTNI